MMTPTRIHLPVSLFVLKTRLRALYILYLRLERWSSSSFQIGKPSECLLRDRTNFARLMKLIRAPTVLQPAPGARLECSIARLIRNLLENNQLASRRGGATARSEICRLLSSFARWLAHSTSIGARKLA